MVARFAEQMFVGGGKYTQERAVDQLTLLWCNALGLLSDANDDRTSTNGDSGKRVGRIPPPVGTSRTTA
jgi:hypothetical protein